MGPPAFLRNNKAKRVDELLASADSLRDQLERTDSHETLLRDIYTRVKQLPLDEPSIFKERARELDAKGTELWNLATRLRRGFGVAGRGFDGGSGAGEGEEGKVKVLCHARAFALMMLDAAWRGGRHAGKDRDAVGSSLQAVVRLVKVAIKAGRMCLELQELELCLRVVERAAVYMEELEASKDERREDRELVERLKAEYYMLRTALAWKQDRLDIAEHMYKRIDTVGLKIAAVTAEELADVLYEIGRQLASHNQFEHAVKWLDRALDIINRPELETLSMEAGELRVGIIQALIQALLKCDTEESKAKASQVVSLAEMDYADRPIMSLLQLDLVLAAEQIDPQRYHDVLQRMVRSFTLTPKNMKTLLFHIHKLKDHSHALAGRLLEQLLESRLLNEPDDKQEWIEKALVTRIFVAVSDPDQNAVLGGFMDLLDRLYAAFRQPAGEAATHAAQTLLWRQIESAFNSRSYDVSDTWCRCALHRMFENCGELNRAKIHRKLMLCYLERGQAPEIRQVFGEMSERGKAEPLTRYILYKAALRDNDDELATEQLDTICKATEEDSTLLFACVLDAQQAGNKRQTVSAIRAILKRYNGHIPAGVHLPTLLRCMIKLLLSDLKPGAAPCGTTMSEVCGVFDIAADKIEGQAQSEASESEDFDGPELEWFSRMSYNLAIEHCNSTEPLFVAGLARCAEKFLAKLIADQPNEKLEGLYHRQLICHWLQACAHVVVARGEDEIRLSRDSYAEARRCGGVFRDALSRALSRKDLDASREEDLFEKHFQIVKLELEAALKLQQWGDMDGLFVECWKYDSPRHWETLADLVLVIHASMVEAKLDHAQLAKIYRVLQDIVRRACNDREGDPLLLAQWLRCLYQITETFDHAIGAQCLEEALRIAQIRKGTARAYPAEELEWLATTSFNRAIDFYCAGDDPKTKLWAEKALMLADALGDAGDLHALLQEKYSGLTWAQTG